MVFYIFIIEYILTNSVKYKGLFVGLDKLGKDYMKNLQKFDDNILLLF